MPFSVSGKAVRLRVPPPAARDRRSAKNAYAPIDQSREAHHSARPLHSPEGWAVNKSQAPSSLFIRSGRTTSAISLAISSIVN
jgi:hypothetical protein